MSAAGDIGWAVRLLRDVDLVSGRDVEARRLSIVMAYFDSIRRVDRRGTIGAQSNPEPSEASATSGDRT